MAASPYKGRRPVTQGKFENETWYCDCTPTLPAVRFQVKKKSPNSGKWFYTCPKVRRSQCGFFLFEDQAQAREKAALFAANKAAAAVGQTPNRSNMAVRAETPHSEYAPTVADTEPLFSPTSTRFNTPAAPRQRIFRGVPRSPDEVAWVAGRGDDSDEDSDGTAGDKRAPPPPATPTSKRKRFAGEDEDDARPGAGNARGRHKTIEVEDLDADEVMQLVEMAESSQQQAQPSQQPQRSQFSDKPVTPHKKGMAASFGGLPTPESRNHIQAASEPGAKRFKTAQGAATSLTPTPARTRNALSQPQQDSSCEDDAEITIAVMGLLRGESIQLPVRRAIRETLNLHALKARGVERGRDLLREAVKSRDQKITELQARVVKLESERLVKRERLKRATSDLQALFQDGGDDD